MQHVITTLFINKQYKWIIVIIIIVGIIITVIRSGLLLPHSPSTRSRVENLPRVCLRWTCLSSPGRPRTQSGFTPGLTWVYHCINGLGLLWLTAASLWKCNWYWLELARVAVVDGGSTERRGSLNKMNIGPFSQLEIQHLLCLFKIKQRSKQTLKLMSHKWSWSLSSALKWIMIKASFLATRRKLIVPKGTSFQPNARKLLHARKWLNNSLHKTKCATMWSYWAAATQNLNSHFQFAAGGAASHLLLAVTPNLVAHPSASAVVLLIACYLFFFFF